MTSIVPYIPDSAPFNPEQRAWLNGFLAGVFSGAPAASAQVVAKPASLRFGVYFATQTGTAERLAKKMVKELKAQGHSAEIASLEKDDTRAAGAAGERVVLCQHVRRRRSAGECDELSRSDVQRGCAGAEDFAVLRVLSGR